MITAASQFGPASPVVAANPPCALRDHPPTHRTMQNIGLLATAAMLSTASFAQDDIWTRQALFDTPDGPKQKLKDQGVDIGVQLTQFAQHLQDSDAGWPYGGKFDFRFTLNGQKLGTWPGFFVTGCVLATYWSPVSA